ncbi:MAG: sigma-70 family RNA polymerase sigma factor [Verrucomicrobiae bacterium]|nr:sigma-70 family RNA polymerase sigma factor [Verrucomicrobiae bacterium]
MTKPTRNHHHPSRANGPKADSIDTATPSIIPVVGDGARGSKMERFEILLRRYEPLVFSVCRELTGDQRLADLCCEEVFVEVFRYPEDLTLSPTRFLQAVLRLALDRADDMMKSQSELIARGRWDAISGLEEEDRNIFLLRFLGKVEIEELSGLFGLTSEMVKHRLWQAMSHLYGRQIGDN